MTQHVITVESTQLYRCEVPPEMAEHLTYEGTHRNILGRVSDGMDAPLEFDRELKRTFECSCGRRFRKGETAREHLEGTRDRS